MSSEHEGRTFPVQAYIFATVLAALVYLLVAALNDFGTATWAAPFILGWAWLSLWIFGKLDPSEEAAGVHATH